MSDDRNPWEHVMSAGDMLASALVWLDKHPDAPLWQRVSIATVIAGKGDQRNEAPITEIAELAGCSVDEVTYQLRAVKESHVSGGDPAEIEAVAQGIAAHRAQAAREDVAASSESVARAAIEALDAFRDRDG